MGILAKDPVMAKRYKMWTYGTLVVTLLVLAHQPSCVVGTGTKNLGDTGCVAGDPADTDACLPNKNMECTGTTTKTCTCTTEYHKVGTECAKKCDTAGASDAKCTGTTGTTQCLPSTAATDAQLVCGKPCASCTTGECIYKTAAASACFLECGTKVCDPAVSECNAGDNDCKAKTCAADANCPGHKCVTASDGKAKVCGKACASACKDTKQICVATDLTASECKACSETYSCPEGKTCTDGKCEEAAEPQIGNTTVVSPSDTTNATKNTDNTVDTNDDNMSTTANNTNSAPGMPSAAGSLILLTCAAALVLAAA